MITVCRDLLGLSGAAIQRMAADIYGRTIQMLRNILYNLYYRIKAFSAII